MSTNIIRNQKPVKGRTIATKFKNDECITLEQLAEQYGWEFEKFLELLKDELGSRTFAEFSKANNKRKKKRKSGGNYNGSNYVCSNNKKNRNTETINIKEEKDMKARIINKADTTVKEAKPVEEVKVSKTATPKTLEELQETKKVLETQINSEEGAIASQEIYLQMAEEEMEGYKAEVDKLKEQLATAEENLFNKDCEIEKIRKTIEEISQKKQQYQEELQEVEASISKLTMVYLVAPSYKASRFPSGKLVSNVAKEINGVKAELIEMPKVVLPFTPEEIEEFGYDSFVKFREDYNFVLLVKKFKEEGANVKVLTYKAANVNKLLDFVIGEGEW